MKAGVVTFLLLACGCIAASESRAQGFSGNMEAVYDQDDRIDWGEITDDEVKQVARASVAIFDKNHLVRLGEYAWEVTKKIGVRSDYPACATNKRTNEKKCLPVCSTNAFVNQRQASGCSGTLVAPDIVVTAGHCFGELRKDSTPLKDSAFVFGYFAKNAKHPGQSRFSFRQVYYGEKLIRGVLTQKISDKPGWIRKTVQANGLVEEEKITNLPDGESEDWVVVRLNKPVPPEVAVPVKVRKERLPDNAILAIYGYPDRLPFKYAPNGTIRSNGYKHFFITNLDAFHGNSGSGVFIQDTKELVGILVRGDQDYVEDPERNCMRTNVCRGRECMGEDVTRIGLAWP